MKEKEKEEPQENNNYHFNKIFSLTYEELRRLASSVKKGSYIETINPTALVNEAYLKMMRSKNLKSTSKDHFKRIAARAMRQVLVDALRCRMSLKRGRDVQQVQINNEIDADPCFHNFIAFNEELNELYKINQRQGQLIELHFFGGYTIAEIAKLLDVSESTAWRDYRTAKAWLKVHIKID